MFGIAPVVPLLPDAPGTDLRGISQPQFEAQFGQQALEPTGVPRRFHPHSYLDSFPIQLAIEPLGFSIAVHQPLLATFPGLRVYPGDLLYAWVIVTTYNEHHSAPFFPSPWSFALPSLLRSRGADAFMKSIIR